MWWQGSQIDYLKYDDHNLSWFHHTANDRRAANQIVMEYYILAKKIQRELSLNTFLHSLLPLTHLI